MTAQSKALCIDPHWQGRARCRACAVRAAMPVAPEATVGLEPLLLPIQHVMVGAGTRLADAGATSRAVFTLRAGFVKLYDITAEGRPRIVRLLGPGDVIGLEALAGRPHAHIAETITSVDACRIPTRVLHDLEERHPAVHQALLALWAAALRQADTFIVGLSSGSAPARMARLLDLLVSLADGAAPPRLSRQEIAAACGLTPETASRIASEWIAQGWLRESDTSFEVDRAVLRRHLDA